MLIENNIVIQLKISIVTTPRNIRFYMSYYFSEFYTRTGLYVFANFSIM